MTMETSTNVNGHGGDEVDLAIMLLKDRGWRTTPEEEMTLYVRALALSERTGWPGSAAVKYVVEQIERERREMGRVLGMMNDLPRRTTNESVTHFTIAQDTSRWRRFRQWLGRKIAGEV